MRIGYIDYLNCYPFYYHMFEKKPLADISIISGFPSELNKMMQDKELDLSPISSATYPYIQDDVLLLPQFCLSSVGYVGSVILYSRLDIDQLNGKKIGLSNASHTSRVLLKILLKRFYNCEPVYLPAEPCPDLKDYDALLCIGNDAMTNNIDTSIFKFDLGELWLKKTGYPVVFAVFAVRKQVIKEYMEQFNSVVESYKSSIRCLFEEKDEVVNKARQKYPSISYDVDSYYKTLQFEFNDNLKNALSYYLKTANQLGLLEKVESLNFADV
ncbi:MAG: menaquinone biosynthesis protein [Proteobacteria bacterium]|nr:menaquinone biosynthesis protein [Pseudomonadota bacterium]